MIEDDDVAVQIKAVREFLIREVGSPDIPLDRSRIPVELSDITELAAQFGIGDDGAREAAIELMPRKFVEQANALLKSKRAQLDRWFTSGEWSLEKNAFSALRETMEMHAAGDVPIDQAEGGAVPQAKLEIVRSTIREFRRSGRSKGDT